MDTRQGAVPSASVDELAYPGVWESDMAITFVISNLAQVANNCCHMAAMGAQASMWVVAAVPMPVRGGVGADVGDGRDGPMVTRATGVKIDSCRGSGERRRSVQEAHEAGADISAGLCLSPGLATRRV